MLENEITYGSIETSLAEKLKLAEMSLEFNCKNSDFCKLFPELASTSIDY